MKTLGLDNKPIINAEDIQRLKIELREDYPVSIADLVIDITGDDNEQVTKNSARQWVEEYISYLQTSTAKIIAENIHSPSLKNTAYGTYEPNSKTLTINPLTTDSRYHSAETIYHELTHWLHLSLPADHS